MQNRKRDTDLQNSHIYSVGEGEGGMFQENSIETCILSKVKQITSPGWMHETSARTWCSGKTWRERVERELGWGIGMGKTCKLKAVSFQYDKIHYKLKKKNKKPKNCATKLYKEKLENNNAALEIHLPGFKEPCSKHGKNIKAT